VEDRIISATQNRCFARQFSTFPEWQSPEKLFRFMQYSAAMYGCKMFIYESRHPWRRYDDFYRMVVIQQLGIDSQTLLDRINCLTNPIRALYRD